MTPEDEIAKIERGLVLYMRVLLAIGIAFAIAAGLLWAFGGRA